MILSHRDVQLTDLGVRFADHAVLHSRYRIMMQVREGIVDDEAFLLGSFSRRPGVGRTALILPLWGIHLLRRSGGEAELRPGGWVGEWRDNGWTLRRNGTARTLIIEWDSLLSTRRIASGASGTISSSSLEAIRDLVSVLIRKEGRPIDASLAVRTILRILRAEGLPFDDPDEEDLVEEVPPHLSSLGKIVDTSLSSLGNRPMLSDVQEAMGRSRPPILKYLREYHERYAYNAEGGWRELLQRWRMTLGTYSMTAKDATTSRVAESLGYSTPSAFCYALSKAGLPSPGVARDALRKMG